MADLKTQAFGGIKWTAVSKVYTAVVKVLQLAILARFLTKEDFGLMGIAVLVNSFCLIFADMGMATAAMHETQLTREKFSSLYWFNLFIGLILTIIVSLCAPLIANYYNRSELVGIVSVTSLLIFVNSSYSLHRTLQQKNMNFRFMSFAEIISSTVVLISNIIFAIKGFGVYSLVWSSLIGSLVNACLYLFVALFIEHSISLHFKIKEVTDALQIGLFQVGSSTIDFFSREMDSFIVSSYMSLELFGIYTLFKNLAMNIYQVINPIVTNVTTPVFAKLQDNKEVLKNGYIKTVNMLGFVNFPIYSILAVSSFSVVSILYGSSYTDYAFVLSCLAIYYAFQSCGNPVGALLIATGRTDRGFYWTIFRIVFTGVYLYIAAHYYLFIFVFLIVLLPIILSYPNWYIVFRKIISIDFKTFFNLSFIPFLACLPLFPLYYLDRFINAPIIGLPIVSALFVAGYYYINRLYRRSLLDEILTLAISQFKKDEKN